MDYEDQFTHSFCAFQVDSQEHLNRFLEEQDRIKKTMSVSGIPIDPHNSPAERREQRTVDECGVPPV